jgi:hypothetical protein
MPIRSGWTSHPVTATIIGIIAAAVTITITEAAGHALLGKGDPAVAGSITVPMYLWVLGGWLIGTSVGAYVASRWSRTSSVVPGVIIGCFILFGALVSFLAFPHPLWMMLAGIAMPLVGYVVARTAVRQPA